jgi:hypothetical protein
MIDERRSTMHPAAETPAAQAASLRIYQREAARFLRALEHLQRLRQAAQQPLTGIAMCHYPPIGADLQDNEITRMFDRFEIDHAVFGHLHSVADKAYFGRRARCQYHLCSADYLQFTPKLIHESPH